MSNQKKSQWGVRARTDKQRASRKKGLKKIARNNRVEIKMEAEKKYASRLNKLEDRIDTLEKQFEVLIKR